MVWIPPHASVDRLNAFLLTPISDETLQRIKDRFALGSCLRFNPLLELVIKEAPDEYKGKSHAYIRAKETEAGRTGPFVLIDERASSDGAVWYVDKFASQDQVDDGEVESTSVLLKILVKVEDLAITYVNYDICNMTIEEDLGNCGVDFPIADDFEQDEVLVSGLDMEEEQYHQDTWVTVEPGEFEESADGELRKNFMPMPEKIAKIHDDIATENGLIPGRWTIPTPARPRDLPDGTTKEFPEGSVVLQTTYDPNFAWPEYHWPEGSL